MGDQRVNPTLPPVSSSGSDHIRSAVLEFASTVSHSWSLLTKLWSKRQVSHRGQYSIERLLAFDEYCESVSLVRVIGVCVVTPLLSLAIVLLKDCIPLRAAEDGWAANYVFRARFAGVIFLISFSGIVQAKEWIPELPITYTEMVALSVAVGTIAVGMMTCLAAYWAFPVPFMSWVNAPMVIAVGLVAVMLLIGRESLKEIPNRVFRFQQYLQLIGAQGLLMMIYPSYHVLFLQVNPELRLPLISLLTVVRAAMMNLIAFCGDHLEDHLPETVVFTVETFNAIYMAVCMQNLQSWWMVVLLMHGTYYSRP